MSTPILYGFGQSSYVITARATAALKGVELDFRPIVPGEHKQPEHLARHPWGKIPTFEHGSVELYETAAIARYLDEAFDGPSLQPTSATGRALVSQWISVANDYLYGHIVRPYVLKYVFADEGGPDQAQIDAAMVPIQDDVEAIAAALGTDTYLVENTLSLADLFVVPLLMGGARFPEFQALIEKHQNLGKMMMNLANNPAFMSALPKG